MQIVIEKNGLGKLVWDLPEQLTARLGAMASEEERQKAIAEWQGLEEKFMSILLGSLEQKQPWAYQRIQTFLERFNTTP